MPDYAVTLFFSNSNISPEAEYIKRRDNARILSERYDVPIIEDRYDHEAWLGFVDGNESELEGGRRCPLCFTFNLSRAADYATHHGFALYTTTLTVSPHKPAAVIFRVGREIAQNDRSEPVRLLEIDFKKKGGFLQSLRLSKAFNLYRQSYCGCEFSRRERENEKTPSL